MRNKILSPELEEDARILDRFNREQLHHIARKGHDRPLDNGFLGLSPREIESFSILRAAAHVYNAVVQNFGILFHRFTGLEKECHDELVKQFGEPFSPSSFYLPRDITHARAMSTTPGSKGGYFVGVEQIGFQDMLQNASVCFSLGAPRIQNQKDNAVMPRQLTGPTFTWLGGAGSSVTATDMSFGQLSASPRTIVSLTELSEQLVQQMSPVSEAGVRRNLAKGLASGADQAMLVGTGGAQPNGIVNTPGIGSVSGTSLDRAKIIDMQTKANDQSAVLSARAQGYVAPPVTAALLAGRQEFTGTSTTLWQGSLAEGTVAGVTARSTKSMTVGSLLYGDFSQVVLVEFGPLQIAVNTADFNKALAAIRALWMVDVIVAEPTSFTLATSVT
jgi:HK97 family phage major capsid protein